MSALFIAFEGGEGAGKTLHCDLLEAWLVEQGVSVVRTREPGGTPAGEVVRSVLLGKEFTGLNERSEALLFAASRAEHVSRVIAPALSEGTTVVCDRFVDSSIAYQGVGRGLTVDRVRELNAWATGDLVPDVTVVVDVDPVIGLARVHDKDRLESEPLEYHRRVRQAFLDFATAEPHRYLVVDGSQDPQAAAREIRQRVSAVLN